MLTRAAIPIAASNALIVLCGLLSGIVVARMLGPEGRGELAVVLLWPSIIGYVVTLGADVELGRRTAQGNAQIIEQLILAGILASVYSLAIVLPSTVALPLFFVEDKLRLIDVAQFAMLAAPAIAFNSYLGAVALGAHRFLIYNISRIAVTVGYLAFLMMVWLIGTPKLSGVTAAYVTSVWCGSAISAVLLMRSEAPRRVQIPRERFTEVASAGLPFVPGYVLFAITNNLSVLWLAALSDSRSLGLFVVAMTLANSQQIISHALAKTAFASTVAVSGNAYTDSVTTQLRRSFVVMAAMVVSIIILGPWLIPVIFGKEFSASAGLLVYLAPAVGFFALDQILEEMLKAKGQGTPSTLARVTSAVCISICAILAIPKYGSTGMAVGLLIGATIEFAILMAAFCYSAKLNLRDLVFPRVRAGD